MYKKGMYSTDIKGHALMPYRIQMYDNQTIPSKLHFAKEIRKVYLRSTVLAIIFFSHFITTCLQSELCDFFCWYHTVLC